jgi:hypothetical protein
MSRKLHLGAGLALGTAVLASSLQAQDDKLTVHGSFNVGYGKTDGLPYFGMTKDGTSDYRAVALQFGYKIDDKDRIVTQFLHRNFGESPLKSVTPAIEPIWAFYEHKFDGGYTLKVGRNPLPRGLFNEVRFIGTLLPFYRVGNSVYGETLEYIDGAVLGKSFDLGADWSLDSYVFAGGYDLKYQIPLASGTAVGRIRNENSLGTQLWLKTPIKGVKVGTFVQSYQSTPNATLPPEQRSPRTLTAMYSADATFSKVFARAEYSTFDTKAPGYLKFRSYYVQGGITPDEHWTFAAEFEDGFNDVSFSPAPIPNIHLPLNQDLFGGVTYKPSSQVAFKLEAHQVQGYAFDKAVASIIPPKAPPLVATLAPKSNVYYGLLSVAFSF